MTPNESPASDVDDDEVMDAFVQDCRPAPTERQVLDWEERFPTLRDRIRETAELMLEYPPSDDDDAPDVGGGDIQDAVLATMRVVEGLGRRSETFPELLERTGETIPHMARSLDIHRCVLADVVAGLMCPVRGDRLVASAASFLGVDPAIVHASFVASFAAPSLGHASSDGAPLTSRRTYADSIEASPMPAERKAFWLGDD